MKTLVLFFACGATMWSPNGGSDGSLRHRGAPTAERAATLAVAAIDGALSRTPPKMVRVQTARPQGPLTTGTFSSVQGSSPNPAVCSVGTGHPNDCSTAHGGGDGQCSIIENGTQSADGTCSVLAGGSSDVSNAFCSVDSGQHSFCSVEAHNINPTNECSVKSKGDDNTCSVSSGAANTTGNERTTCSVKGDTATDRVGTRCSVFGGPGNRRFCSVYKNAAKDHQCTVFDNNGPVNETRCSTQDVAGVDLCSVIDGSTEPPTVTPPTGNPPVCRADQV